MKKLLILIAVFISFTSCKEEPSQGGAVPLKTKNDGAYAKSAGRMNTLTIVMDNALWEGEIGNELRKGLADGVSGLPQDEPLFTIRQMSPVAFTGFARKSRCFLRITENKPASYEVLKNKYARPQVGIEILGNTNKNIIETFKSHKEEIIRTFKAVELLNRQNTVKNPLVIKGLKENLGISVRMPKVYRVAKDSEDFYWIRKNITHGSMDLLLYELPMDYFKDSLSITQNIIRMRDEIAGDNIVVGEGGRFITEEAFSPYVKETKLLGFDAFETRGTWEVKNKFMAGPFINYVIKDTTNNRLLILEGFVFAPSVNKRDYLFDLEAIIKSVSLK